MFAHHTSSHFFNTWFSVFIVWSTVEGEEPKHIVSQRKQQGTHERKHGTVKSVYSDHLYNDILDLPVGFRVPTEFVCAIERITFITIWLTNYIGPSYKSLYVQPKNPLRNAEFNAFFVFTNFVSMLIEEKGPVNQK